jgi:hypothetical protein
MGKIRYCHCHIAGCRLVSCIPEKPVAPVFALKE